MVSMAVGRFLHALEKWTTATWTTLNPWEGGRSVTKSTAKCGHGCTGEGSRRPAGNWQGVWTWVQMKQCPSWTEWRTGPIMFGEFRLLALLIYSRFLWYVSMCNGWLGAALERMGPRVMGIYGNEPTVIYALPMVYASSTYFSMASISGGDRG